MKREAFLQRVREATSAARAFHVSGTGDVPEQIGYQGAGDDPLTHIAREVAETGGHPHVVDDLAAARKCVAELICEHQAQSALCWRHALLEELDLKELLTSLGVTQVDYDRLRELSSREQREQMLAADIGITSATCAVAETGTLAVASGPGCERVASLLPPVHVAVVERSQIVPDLFDLFARIDQEGDDAIPSNLTLITGPSKTGDIELKLTTGVHGPGQWHVVLIR